MRLRHSISPQVRSLQQACKAAEAAAKSVPDAQLTASVLGELQAAREVLHGLGPGGDL